MACAGPNWGLAKVTIKTLMVTLVVHFPLDKIGKVCELAGARRSHHAGH
jgi:hypothetical protein